MPIALAGGVNLSWRPKRVRAAQPGGMLSRRGAAAPSTGANGYVRGEGGGVLVLKRLAQARADGDPVHAVIRGVAVNNGGRPTG